MIIKALTKWLSFRTRKAEITTIVLHATAGPTLAGALSTLILKGFSYHAIISDQREKDGQITKCVPDAKIAFHAGKSTGPEGPNVNGYSLGAAFVNLNDGQDPYSERQVEAMLDRCVSWCQAYPSIKYITTHYWISPGRKFDPRQAPGFDVLRFHERLVNRLGRTIYLWRPSPKARVI